MPVDKGDDNTEREALELKLHNETVKARERRIADAWEIALASPQGRAVVWDIISQSRKDDSPARLTDAETNREIGRGDYGRELYDKVKTAYPRRFLEMITENLK